MKIDIELSTHGKDFRVTAWWHDMPVPFVPCIGDTIAFGEHQWVVSRRHFIIESDEQERGVSLWTVVLGEHDVHFQIEDKESVLSQLESLRFDDIQFEPE